MLLLLPPFRYEKTFFFLLLLQFSVFLFYKGRTYHTNERFKIK